MPARLFGIEAEGSGQDQLPAGRRARKLRPGGRYSCGAEWRRRSRSSARAGAVPLGNGTRTSAVRDHSDPRRFDVQQLLHLARGEGETAMIKSERSAAARACAAKRCAEIGSRVIARDHEQIVEGGDAAAVTGGAQTLVQSVKKIGGWPAILPRAGGGRRWREDDRRTSAGSGAGDSRTR